jgi:hypothetical protein
LSCARELSGSKKLSRPVWELGKRAAEDPIGRKSRAEQKIRESRRSELGGKSAQSSGNVLSRTVEPSRRVELS